MVLAVHNDASYLNEKWQEAVQLGIFHVKHQCVSTEQWHSPQHTANHKSTYVIHSTSRGALPQCKASHAHETNNTWNGAPSSLDANPNRQLHSIWRGDTQDHPKGHRSNGHAPSSAPPLQTTATMLILLVTSSNKFANYWTKHHPVAHHKQMQKVFLMDSKTQAHSQPTWGDDGKGMHQLDTNNTAKTMQHIKANRTSNGISHSQVSEQLQGCVGIPKLPNPNRQWPDGAKNRPNPN